MTKASQVLPITWLAHAERTNTSGLTASQSPAICGQPPREFHDISINLLVCRRVPRNHRNLQKTMPDPSLERQIDSKNRSKIAPKWCPGGAWGIPGASLGPPGGQSGPVFIRNCKFMKNWKLLEGARDIPGSLREARGTQKIDKKSTLWWKKTFQTGIFFSIFVHKAVFRAFPTISIRFFTKNLRKI